MNGKPRASTQTKAPAQAPNIRLKIGNIRLQGFGHLNSGTLKTTLTGELHRLLSTRKQPFAKAPRQTIDKLNGGALTLPPHASAQSLGEKMAQRIFDSLPP